mgnify:CR=1 FL=1
MQPGEEIESLLDELEQVVSEAKAPFTGGMQKKIVDSREIYEIIDEIRSMFPQEFADARRILKEEDEILGRAQQQADSIIADAQQQAEEIRGQASQYERDTRYNAEEYADTVLQHLEDNLKSLTNSVTRVRETLDENSGPRNQSNNVTW